MRRRDFMLGLLAQATPPLPVYSDITRTSGIGFRHQASKTSRKYLIESVTGGVAMFDYDGDGRLDLFFINGAALKDPMKAGQRPDKSDPRFWNRLYRNNGDGTFTDVTEKAGVAGHSYGMGVAVGDFNNDGKPDLFVTNLGRNILYRNNGDGTFTDITDKAGVAGGGWSTSACWVDFDHDGLLDLVVTRYVEWDFEPDIWCGRKEEKYRSYCHPDQFKPISYLVYRNNGDGTFTDVSKSTGIAASPGKGLGVAIHDIDGDGRIDLIFANDSYPQQYFRNLGGGRFKEMGLDAGMAYDDDGRVYGGMGIDVQDYDNDGWPDIFINALALQRYALYKNQKGLFSYASEETGVSRITRLRSGWGARFLDYDNDGWKDLCVAQGHVMDNIGLTQPGIRYLEPLLLMRNSGGRFIDVSRQAGAPFQMPLAARGMAFGDLDNDGFLDAAINCNDGPAVVLRNHGGNGNHWLLVNTAGTKSNRDGIGARIKIVPESGPAQYGIVTTSSSYLSAGDKRVHFGLGAARKIKLLEINWPSGIVQREENLDADRVVNITEPAS